MSQEPPPRSGGPVRHDRRGINAIFVHSDVDDAGLSPAEFRIYGHLARRAGQGEAYPGIESMAQVCRMNHKTVREAIKVLLGRQMVKRFARPGFSPTYVITSREEWVEYVPDEAPLPKEADPNPSQNERHTPPKMSGTPLPKGADEGNPLKDIHLRESKGKGPKAEKKSHGELFDIPEDRTHPLPPPLDTHEVTEGWHAYLEMRTKIRKPITPRVKTRLVAELKAMGPEKAALSLWQSARKGWIDIYTPKGDTTTKTNTNPITKTNALE